MRGFISLTIVFSSVLGFAQNEVNNALNPTISQTEHYLNLFIKTDISSPYSGHEINEFISRLETKKSCFKHDKDFLHYLFFKTHRKLLKRYTEYCPFDAMLKDGTYNCLTGTALYAMLLNHFNFDYKVVETNYHIFLMVKIPNKGEILFEATDPIEGFVDSDQEIQARINVYKENQIINRGNEKVYYSYNFNLYNAVNMEQLLGLMYYNLSIDAYNKHDLSASINYLDQSAKLYQSPRIEDFSKIVLWTLAEQKLTKVEKEICLKKIQSLQKKMPGLTSAK